MRLPARAVTGHLVWSRDGAVWAVWAVDATSWDYLPRSEQLAVHSRLRGALMVLPPESMLLSLCRRLDPGEVVERMIEGVDLQECPAWRAEAAATLDDLATMPLHERRHYLAARLPGDTVSSLAAARATVAERFALAPTPPRVKEVQARLRQSALLEARLGAALGLRRVSAGELRWVYARAVRRGVDEPYLDSSWDTERRIGDGDSARVTGPSLHTLADAVFFEGGARDDVDRPRHRRYLRIDTAAMSSYQTFLAVADMPREWLFPGGGGEWFRHLDDVAWPVDWCARVTAVANQEAQLKARKQARQLMGQFEQHDGEASGAPHDLADAVEGVDEERHQLATNKNEPELQTTVVLATWADRLADLEAQAEQLQSMFAGAEYGLARPTGGQLALFCAMLPGSATPPVARDYTQYLLPRDLAAGLPYTGQAVGDPRGLLLGYSTDTAGAVPVLFDPAWGPSQQRSGSIGVAGHLGSGKSYLIKRIAHATLARGGQVVALDRTERGEYAAFADVVPGRSQVVRLTADSPVCLDPLQVFTGDDRVTVTTGFLTLLTQTAPSELDGVALAEAVQTVAERPDATLLGVVDELERLGGDDPDAHKVFRKLRSLARSRLAGLAFNTAGRELLTLDADYMVLHTPGLVLPPREVLLNEHLSRRMLPEQVFSQALLYLMAAVMRKVTFRDWSRFAAAALDEVWALTASLEGKQLLLDLVRDGRKHNAAAWLLSQHPYDLGDDQLTHLLGNRFVFRQDPGAIPAAARFLGVDADAHVSDVLESAASGQCLYRDGLRRIGRIQVLPAAEHLHAAFDTNPTARDPAGSGGHVDTPPAGVEPGGQVVALTADTADTDIDYVGGQPPADPLAGHGDGEAMLA